MNNWQLAGLTIRFSLFACISLETTSGCGQVVESTVYGWGTVGEKNNLPDSKTKMGRVSNDFQIMATEVTNEMYCDFLNAVARDDDPFKLYSHLMESHFWGGISKVSLHGKWHYTCKKNYEQLPCVFVSWFDAARFVNWFHFGKPRDLGCVLATTEGNANVGAYDTRDFPDSVLAAVSARQRNREARYWLPSGDEWIKAGFYGGDGKWWRYATMSDSTPTSTGPTIGDNNAANYYRDGWAAPAPHLLPVRSYPATRTWAGTFDQAGNVAEWVEDIVPDGRGFRKALGGALFRQLVSLERNYFEGDRPDKKLSTFGFRVARTVNASAPPRLDKGASMGLNPSQGSGVGNKASAVTGDYVLIGDPGNPADVFYGSHGAVGYAFEMARCELNNQEYISFLNAVAQEADPFGLYDVDQTTGILGGIVREETSDGKWLYSAKPGWGKRPVNYISWWSLARYANWHHYGKPAGGRSGVGTTEGTSTTGAYDTRLFEAVKNGKMRPGKDFGKRNLEAKYWIPNEDEWYKAAYYDPTKMGARPYWDFPVQTDNIPDNFTLPGGGRSINYQKDDDLAVGPPFYLAEVDAYPAAASHYGTLQQGGNVWEWLEGWQYGKVGVRALRGGSFGYTEIGPHASNCDPGEISERSYVFGGRLARTAGNQQEVHRGFKDKVMLYVRKASMRQWMLAIVGAGIVSWMVGFTMGRGLRKSRKSA